MRGYLICEVITMVFCRINCAKKLLSLLLIIVLSWSFSSHTCAGPFGISCGNISRFFASQYTTISRNLSSFNNRYFVPKLMTFASFLSGSAYTFYRYWYKPRTQFQEIIPEINRFSDEAYLGATVQVGNSSCRGTEKRVGNVVATQIHVLDQHDDNNCGTASCGYHAVKNALKIASALAVGRNDLDERVHDETNVQQLFGLPDESGVASVGNWRQAIIDKRNGGEGEWLNKEEIEQLVSQKNVTVIEDLSLLGSEFTPSADRRTIATCSLRNRLLESGRLPVDPDNSDKSRHSFILGTMRHGIDRREAGGNNESGHWLAVVLNQVGRERHYILADSKNKFRLYGGLFRKLMRHLEGEAVSCQLKASDEELDRLGRSLKELSNINSCLFFGQRKTQFRDMMCTFGDRYRAWGGDFTHFGGEDKFNSTMRHTLRIDD